MYLRETKRRNKDGSTVSYLQLAHNERHPQTGSPIAKVIHSFGRADQVDREARAESAEDHGPKEQATRRFNKHSKDHRSDLPQVVLGMAVTAEGIPIRCWTFPGNTSDQAIMKTIRDDLAGWMLNRVVWVTDSSFNSAANRAYLQRGGGSYIVAERVRGASSEAKAALARAGCYHKVAGNLEVKEVRLGNGARSQRFIVCHNPEVAARDARVRENLVAYLEKRIAGSDAWSTQRRDELERMHLVTLETADSRVAQRSMTTPRQWEILRVLEVAELARFYDFELPKSAA